MKKIVFVLTIAFSLFLFIMLISLIKASQQNVTFNGSFANGTTLYSSISYFNQTNITAKDAYPIRNCTVINLSQGIKKVCNTVNKTRTCVNVSYMNTVTRCSSLKAYCENPYSNNTNQLSLTNFAYSTDNGTSWYTMPYTKLVFNNISLIFRLNIPSNCYPFYDINQAIKIQF